MADDPYARIAQLEADVARFSAELERSRDETSAARAEQAATAEVLRVIASATADLDQVLSAVAERAMRLCAASNALIFVVNGDEVQRTAGAGPMPTLPSGRPSPLDGTI